MYAMMMLENGGLDDERKILSMLWYANGAG